MTKTPRPAVVLLGAQRFDPSLGAAVSELGVTGRIATITAGWQERESEDEELAAHLGDRTVNLRLHARGDELFREDPELRDAHREHANHGHYDEKYCCKLDAASDCRIWPEYGHGQQRKRRASAQHGNKLVPLRYRVGARKTQRTQNSG